MYKKIGLLISIFSICVYTFDATAECRCSVMQEGQEITACPCVQGETGCLCIQQEPESVVEDSSPSISHDEAVMILLAIVCQLNKQIEADKARLQNLECKYHEMQVLEWQQNREWEQTHGYTPEPVPMSYGIEMESKQLIQLIKQKEKERAAIAYALEHFLLKKSKPYYSFGQ